MSRNDAWDFARRLYADVPSQYRAYDAERGRPILALLRVIGEQAANLRQDLDALWDNFFIETCDDWVVPYLGALAGTNFLQQPVGQSNRLDVWNTVLWRRSKGTPRMLADLAEAITGWPADVTEAFHSLGWSQNVNHVRLERTLLPDLRDPLLLDRLGRTGDPFAHAADFHPSSPFDQTRVGPQIRFARSSAFGTPGRYQIKNLGVFVRRLATYRISGSSPAQVEPGKPVPAGAALFTFNPLFRNVPLFDVDRGAAISRSGFSANPAAYFGSGSSIQVRQFGVPVATPAAVSSTAPLPGTQPFTFGGVTGITLDPLSGMRLLEPSTFQLGGTHFLITAQWQQTDGTTVALGVLSTLMAANGSISFTAGATAAGTGRLVITVQPGRDGAGWPAPLPLSNAGRFPGAVIAIRASRTGPLQSADALYVYLPDGFLNDGAIATYFVADDGSTFGSAAFGSDDLLRQSASQVYPAGASTASTLPANNFLALTRTAGGLILPDKARFGGAGVLVTAGIQTGQSQVQTLGAIATTDQPAAAHSELQVPDPWPAFAYAPSLDAVNGALPVGGDPLPLLSILLQPLAGSFVPAMELVVTNRAGQSLLVYLPEIANSPNTGVRLLVADDGSTWFASADPGVQQTVLQQHSFNPLRLARAAQGQVLPIPGVWPIQRRVPVAANLCAPERASLLSIGELGVDPELGRFALPPGDPSLALGAFTVDWIEAFGDTIGATSRRQFDSAAGPTRLVSRTGDAAGSLTEALPGAPVHASLAAAIAAAADGDIIEIADSATYAEGSPVSLANAQVKTLTIRAAQGCRPCLTFYTAAGTPAAASLIVAAPMDSLSLNGLLISGGPVQVQGHLKQLNITESTLDPSSALDASLIASDNDPARDGLYLLVRSIAGGLSLGPGVAQLTASDSIIDQRNRAAIAGPGALGRRVVPPLTAGSVTSAVQLERVTVLGEILCEVLRASECLFDDLVLVQDQQSGCVRFSRFEKGSVLPRRYQSIPDESQLGACGGPGRCVAPVFNSRRFGRPDYTQLASGCPSEILQGSEEGAEVGAFASARNTLRIAGLKTKLQEFMPVGLTAVVVAET